MPGHPRERGAPVATTMAFLVRCSVFVADPLSRSDKRNVTNPPGAARSRLPGELARLILRAAFVAASDLHSE
jgi:hypothetical protein